LPKDPKEAREHFPVWRTTEMNNKNSNLIKLTTLHSSLKTMRTGKACLPHFKEYSEKRIINCSNKNMEILQLLIEVSVRNLNISQVMNLGKETKAYR
jgi:hypothetical protein